MPTPSFTAFGAAIAYFDTYLQVGAGVVDTFAGGMLPSGMLGVGTRFYMTRWLALEAEVNDTIFMEKYPSGTTLIQHLSVGMNLALFMPFGWDEDR